MATPALYGVFRCFYASGISLALLLRQNGLSTAQGPRKVRREGGGTWGLHCCAAHLGGEEPRLGTVGLEQFILQQGNPTQEGRMGLFGAPLALGLCIILGLILQRQERAM